MLLDAVEEPTPRPAVCLLGDRLGDGAKPCGAHRRWLDVQSRADEMLQQTTLADLLVDEN
jgi:DNA-binding IscR family transcriptional regulator